jgi:hypothetical protein
MDSMLINHTEALAGLCTELDASQGVQILQQALNDRLPAYDLVCVLTRTHWHRLGGVVDARYQPVSSNITKWAEAQADGDVDKLVAEYIGKGYFATHLAGKTHYFTAPVGDQAGQFLQFEIEELQEVISRPLVEKDWYPDNLEEFIDPLDYSRLEPEPVAKPYYQFRRVTPIANLLKEAQGLSRSQSNLKRFFQDWQDSSASETSPFCRQWVLTLQDYMDSDGYHQIKARPYAVATERLPDLPAAEHIKGAELANAIHTYDRKTGYPFAWYFTMLSCKASNVLLAEAVLRDQLGAYDYLPARDLKVLRNWEARPYAV